MSIYAVVLLDLKMPGKEGRSREADAHGQSSPSDRDELWRQVARGAQAKLAARVADFLEKDMEPAEFRALHF